MPESSRSKARKKLLSIPNSRSVLGKRSRTITSSLLKRTKSFASVVRANAAVLWIERQDDRRWSLPTDVFHWNGLCTKIRYFDLRFLAFYFCLSYLSIISVRWDNWGLVDGSIYYSQSFWNTTRKNWSSPWCACIIRDVVDLARKYLY